MKRLISLISIVLLLVCIAVPTMVFASEDMAAVFVTVPDGWESPHAWAWDDAGNNAFGAWPGGELETDPNNPGWYFVHLPTTMSNIIINAAGGLQTDDYAIENLPVWITVLSEDEVEISSEPLTQGEPPTYVPRFTVYARVPTDWDTVNIWAWLHPEGTNAFPAWPGGEMRRVGDWYATRVPYWVNSIIISGNAGTDQTEDLTIEPYTLWVMVEDDFTATVFYENPDFMVHNITVRAQIPEDWDSPHLWAWLHPEGTNVFPAWPGEPMVYDSGWYVLEIPGWVNSLIVNGNEGTVQTGNIQEVEIGRDVWIVVVDADTYFYDYAEITEIPAIPTSEAPAGEEADSGGGVVAWVWIVIAGAVAAVGVIGVVIFRKRRT